MSDEPKKIYPAMISVMSEIGAIAKGARNQAQGFNFRGIDDVYNAVHQAMVKHQVFCIPRVVDRTETVGTTKSGSQSFRVVLEMEFDFTTTDGSSVTVGPIFGEAMDTSDKATNKANSACHKYAFIMTFAIPTKDMVDADSESPEQHDPRIAPIPKPGEKWDMSPPRIEAPPNPSSPAASTIKRPGISEAQVKRIFGMSRAQGWTDQTLHQLLKIMSHGTLTSLRDMSRTDYETFCNRIEKETPEIALKGQT